MGKIFTRALIQSFVLPLFLVGISVFSNAQINCANQVVIGVENFGQGTTPTSDPNVISSTLTYEPTGELSSEGSYRVINNTQQKPEWHLSTDHTGDVNGKMLVINGQAEVFYQRIVELPTGYVPGSYTISMYIMNIDSYGLCSPDPLVPIISINLEYLSQSGAWVSLVGSPYISAPISQTVSPVWVNIGATFQLPSTGTFIPTKFRATFGDGTVGGCGNDFAMDDLQLGFCPEGGSMPVEFSNINARKKDNGVNVEWSTSQEINNSYFEVERSANGNNGWGAIAKVNGAGNSQVAKNYSAFDANPNEGVNYYRVKQVDFDGNFKYSKTVSVKNDFSATSISILANPFYNSLTINFNNRSSQMVTARLIDITGRQVATEKWSLSSGNSRKDFSNVSSLQPGMYILSIINNSGEVIYNQKVVKK